MPLDPVSSPSTLNTLQESLLVQEEEQYIYKMKQRYIALWQIQSKVLNIVIMLLMLLNLVLYTNMFDMIQDTFLISAQKRINDRYNF